ncbi:MAG TPA: ATP-binding protein [Longimicrobium sp.]|jgi:ATP-dependent DNA helicase RecG
MSPAELAAIVRSGESDKVEFKKTTGQRSDGAKTVCAMLNGQGGFVLFGVTDAGEVSGQQVSTGTMEDLVRELRRIEPQPLLNPERVPLDHGLELIVIPVPGRSGGPYTYEGRPYIRQGPTTVVMPQDEYGRRLVERAHPTHRWEIQPAHGVTLGDLDTAELVRTVDEAIRRLRLEDPGTRDPEALLRGFRLMQGDQPLNAAVALFGRADRLFPNYPQCRLRLARFRGTDKTEFLDNRQEVGNVFDLLIRAQRFLRDHLPIAGRVVPNLFERIDDPLYPPLALREALANALCHRDYTSPGSSVGVAIYDDRLEITSTGNLPFGLTPADLTRPHASQPWNPLMADVFYRRGIIEQWGRGTLKIIDLTEQAGLVAPEFEVRGGEVVVRFYPQGYVPPSRVSHKLSDLQQEILAVLAAIGPSSMSMIRVHLPTPAPRSTVGDNLQLLRQLGLIQLKGRASGARWSLTG